VVRTQGRADCVVSTLGYIVVAPSGRLSATSLPRWLQL